MRRPRRNPPQDSSDGDRYVDVNGLWLHYIEKGDPKGRPVLFVGGIIQQAHVWDPIVRSMPMWRTIALDLRGQGDSDWARDGYSLRTFVSDVQELATRLGLAPFDFVGHSLGARVAMAYAAEYPDACRHIVLSDTGPDVPRDTAIAARREVEDALELRGFRSEERAADAAFLHHPEWQPEFHQIYARHQYRRNWANRLVLKADPDLYWITSAASLPDIEHLRAVLPKIACPALIVWGKRHNALAFLTPETVKTMVATMPRAQVAEFDTSHYTFQEQPEHFVSVLQAFLTDTKVPPPVRRAAMTDAFTKASISTDLARRMIAAAEAKAREIGVPSVVAVCDESGVLKAFSRMDEAPLFSVQVAQDKAYTGVGFGMSSDAWYDFIKSDPPLATGAVGGIDRLVIFGGGYPVMIGGRVAGGIGVSGGHWSQDMEVAKAGLGVLADK